MPPDPAPSLQAAHAEKTPRPPSSPVPAQRQDRERILKAVRDYVGANTLKGQLGLNELHTHAGRILEAQDFALIYRNWTMVLLNNETWRGPYRQVPFQKRLLLLPQCLRSQDHCQAPMDVLGLLCQGCGACKIHALKSQAEGLGYAVLVSEGTAAVLGMVLAGQVQGFAGSGCLSALEKVFATMSMLGIPAIAIPLLRDGCKGTGLDEDWLIEVIGEK